MEIDRKHYFRNNVLSFAASNTTKKKEASDNDYMNKLCFIAENFLYSIVLLCFLYAFTEINRRHYFWSQPLTITEYVNGKKGWSVMMTKR